MCVANRETRGEYSCYSQLLFPFDLQTGTKVFSGGCDHKGMCWDLNTGQSFQVAQVREELESSYPLSKTLNSLLLFLLQHDAPIKIVKWVNNPASSMLCTGSWDKTLRVRLHT